MFDVETQVVLVYAPITQVNKGRLRLGAKGLHQDAGLFYLLTERVPVVRIARVGSGTHDQGAFERGGNAHLHAKFIRVAALAFGDAFDFWGVPAVQLGLFVLSLFAARLSDQPFGFVDAHAQGLLNSLAQSRHLACDLAVQSAYDGALAFDGFAHAFELTGMGVAPSLVAQQLAFFGVVLFELDALGLGRFDQFDASGLEQLAVGGVGKRGRPALETPAPAITSVAPNKSESSIFLPARTWRAKR